MRITQYSVNRRLATSAIAIALVVLGLYGLSRLPVDFLPDVTYPLVKMQIRWPGATPEEIDKDIADPLERLMATVDNLDSLESFAREGVYSLDVSFDYGTDIDVAFQDVLAALTRAGQDLPEDIEPPFVFKADPSQLPVMQLAVSSPTWSPVQLRDWADNWLQERILGVNGVAGAEIVGGLEREIRVLLDPVALEKYRLSLDTVLSRLRAENIERTAGRVTSGRKEIIARTTGEFTSLDEIRSILMIRSGQNKIYLRDIADVEDAHEDERVITRFNGKDCVKISVLKEAEANTVEVADAVAARLADLHASFPDGVSLATIENQAEYVRQSLNGVRDAALGAAVLLIVVVYLFLGSARQVLVMCLGLPLTLIVNFGVMQLAGFSLNIFSLGGLVIAIGVVLDNSIVVIENISRLHNEDPEGEVGPQAIQATSEVGPAIVASTLSFLALFVPFLIVPGLTTLLFRELILVVAGIVVISLMVAVTATPMVAAALFGHRRPARVAKGFEHVFEHITEWYGKSLRPILRWRWLVLPVFVAVLIGGGFLFGRVGGEFLPLMDDGRLMVKVRLPTGTAIRETDQALRKLEQQVSKDPLVDSVFSLAGGQIRGLTTYEIATEGELNIQLVPKAERDISTADYVQTLRKLVAQTPLPGAWAMARQNATKGIKGMQASDLIVQIRGQDTDMLGDLAQRAAETMRQSGNVASVNISMDLSRPEYQVSIDRAKAAELDIEVADVANSLRTLISGTVSTRYREGGEYIDIRTLVPEVKINNSRDIENLSLLRRGGQTLRVRDIAAVRSGVGPVEIIREDQVKQVSIEVDLAKGDLAGGVAQLKSLLADLEYPPGYELSFGGSAEMMTDMKNTVLSVFGFALFFSFIILTVQFNSLKLPTLILGSVPVCLAGVVYALYATGFPLGATVIIGVLVVVAATINDGVLLLTFAGELQERDHVSPFDAVINAAKIRLRPRIMTTLTTMMGFLPLALNIGEGGDMLQPMAIGAIGGLLLEMPVALLLMPCLYTLTTRRGESMGLPERRRDSSP
jgi:hydrophobic/amphiphilic exporter-1 (mainly G- bacteria), HAE1 family